MHDQLFAIRDSFACSLSISLVESPSFVLCHREGDVYDCVAFFTYWEWEWSGCAPHKGAESQKRCVKKCVFRILWNDPFKIIMIIVIYTFARRAELVRS